MRHLQGGRFNVRIAVEQQVQVQGARCVAVGAFAAVGNFDGQADLTEMDALVAYLQMLGTLVDVNSAAAQEELAQEKGR